MDTGGLEAIKRLSKGDMRSCLNILQVNFELFFFYCLIIL